MFHERVEAAQERERRQRRLDSGVLNDMNIITPPTVVERAEEVTY